MTASSIRLSVAMIVKDAAASIAETLTSIQHVADEIVIVDTGSKDETATIANKFPVKWIEHTWQNDFSEARNRCLTEVTGDWILWLDSGETLSKESAEQLRNHMMEQANADKAWMLLVKIPQSSTNIAGEQIGRIRLMPNNRGIRFEGRVRESVNRSLDGQNIAIESLPFAISRSQREHDPTVKSARAERNRLLAELELSELREPKMLVVLADALQELGDRTRAAEVYREAISMAERESTELLEAYYGLLTSLDAGDENGADEQLRVCLNALEVFPLDAQLLCALGGYLQTLGRWDLATRSYETAFRFGQVNPETWHLDDLRAISAVCFCLALQLQNNDAEAQEILTEALNSDPTSIRIRRALIDLHIKHARETEALENIDALPVDAGARQQLADVVRGAILASQKQFERARPFLQTAYEMGCREIICLRWLAVALIAHEDHTAASKVLATWQSIDPTNQEIDSYLKLLPSEQASLPADSSNKKFRIDPGATSPIGPTATQSTPTSTNASTQ